MRNDEPFHMHTLYMTSKTNINNFYTYSAIYSNLDTFLFAGWSQFIAFRDREI